MTGTLSLLAAWRVLDCSVMRVQIFSRLIVGKWSLLRWRANTLIPFFPKYPGWYLSIAVLLWVRPPALPLPPECFLFLPILPPPQLTEPLSFLVFLSLTVIIYGNYYLSKYQLIHPSNTITNSITTQTIFLQILLFWKQISSSLHKLDQNIITHFYLNRLEADIDSLIESSPTLKILTQKSGDISSLIITILILKMNCFQYDNPAYKIKILDYTYSSQPSINTALPIKLSTIKTVLFWIAAILSFGFIWLLSKWSAKRKAIFTTSICSLEEATCFLIHDEDTQGQSTIVQRQDKKQIRLKRNCISFQYHDRHYIYVQQKEVFVPVRYQQLGMHLDKLRKDKFYPITDTKRTELLAYYGQNVIKLPVSNVFEIFIQEMLTPFQVFQTYGIILWIYQQYYFFSAILLFYSLYCYWKNASNIKKNQQKLAFQSYYDVQTKVLINSNNDPSDEIDEQRIEVELCKNQLKIDEHKSDIMKDNFRGIEDIEQEIQITVKRVERRESREVKNQENVLINSKNVRFQSISSHKLVPGDIIILNQLDIVPCDCILLRGQALVDQRFSTGQNYLVRKEQIENFTYVKQNQKSFNLYLGTTIKKIKNTQFKLKRRTSQNNIQLLQESIRNGKKDDDDVNQLVCLVTHTNFTTLRGKFLRAIRYQPKQQQNFFKQTVYFIYILIVITTLFFFAYLRIIGPYTSSFSMLIIYIDLIFVAIPPTLPTILMLGIQFVAVRLNNHGIHCVFPKSALLCGKVNTIILKGEQVFGRDYEIQSASIGTKGDRGFGLTFSTVNQFQSYSDDPNISHMDIQELQKKKRDRSQFHKIGTYFINSLASCHTLQFFKQELQGSVFQKKIFEFSQARNICEDEFETLNYRMSVHKIIRFRQKNRMLAVIVTMKQKSDIVESDRVERFDEIKQTQQNSITKKYNSQYEEPQLSKKSKKKYRNAKKVVFLKGSAEKVLQNCAKHTYPADAFQYIVDMAEKGFILYCYAMKEVDIEFKDNFDYQEYVNRSQFIFLGFVIMQQLKSEENLQAIKALNDNNVKIIYVSDQRQLQATSKAVSNGICNKNQLILCNITKNRDKVFCKGHIQWQSSTNQTISQFLAQFQDFGKNSKVSLSAPLYTELYMKKQINMADHIFQRTVIYNKMDLKCQRNLYNQLQKRKRVSCAVGISGNLSQSANLSLELERQKSSLLSNFYAKSSSLKTIVNCLRICRAGLSTNLHGFSMMILFTLTQFTSVVILNYNYESMNNDQTLYDDLFLTFPIFITINLTQPANQLSKELPPNSFFGLRNMLSMGGQLLIQFLAQMGFVLFVFSLQHFQNQRQISFNYYVENKDFNSGSAIAEGLFILINNLYLGIVLSTSVSKPFRKPFYTNPFYTLNLIIAWCLNTLLVVFPNLSFSDLRSTDASQQAEFVRILALVVGNLVMVVMYMFQNLLVFIWSKKLRCWQREKTDQIVIIRQEHQGREILN